MTDGIYNNVLVIDMDYVFLYILDANNQDIFYHLDLLETMDDVKKLRSVIAKKLGILPN